MGVLRRILSFVKSIRGIFALTFLVVFILSALTPYLSDDYFYMYSIANGERFTSLAMLYSSIYMHALSVNGRLLPHSIIQVLLLFPKIVFDFCNAGVYLWLLYAVCAICGCRTKKAHPLLPAGIAVSLWLLNPGFGESCLWYSGAVNYLWVVTLCLFFLRPYLSLLPGIEEDHFFKGPESFLGKTLFIFLGFLFGGWSEITSFVGIVIAIGCLLISGAHMKDKKWLWYPLIAATVGFLFMLLMPSEINKSGGFGLGRLYLQIPRKTAMLRDFFSVPIAVWVILLLLSLKYGEKKTARLISFVFFLGAILGNYLLIAAAYVVRRCLFTTTVFLVIACFVLIADLWDGKTNIVCRSICCVLCALFLMSFVIGSFDIGYVFLRNRARERYITGQAAAGVETIYVERINSSTPYSATYALEDLSSDDADAWLNRYMAKYYSVPQMIGTESDREPLLLHAD